MKAMVIRKFGAPDVFEIAEIEKPTPVSQPGDVLIKGRELERESR